MSKPAFPVALEPPVGSVVVLNETLLQPAVAGSRQSPRGRIILPLHKDHGESLHRMMNVMQPGTYIRPHRHSNPPKAESIVVLRGGLWFITFEDDGRVNRFWKLEPGLGDFGVDMMPGVFHSFIVTDPDTVIFEVKPGPYVKASDKDFASWAPSEGDAEVEAYQQELMQAVQSSEGEQ
jgi:cupin fold WbuC family metalloprotein